jgi:hypothetical protein
MLPVHVSSFWMLFGAGTDGRRVSFPGYACVSDVIRVSREARRDGVGGMCPVVCIGNGRHVLCIHDRW